MADLFLIVLIIFIALIFDFINGFHDAANAIATIVATNVLSPQRAVLLAAFWNFIGVFFFGVAIATTIGSGIIDPAASTVSVIFAGLIGAIAWDVITWYFGLPISSSHALIGGLIGSAVTSSGFGILNIGGISKVLVFIVIAPLLGFLGAIAFSILVFFIFKKSAPLNVNSHFRRLQLLSSSLYSLGHGANDAQKTMGIITILLLSGGVISSFHIPLWVIFASYAAISLGTYFGGWRIVKTMGHRITKLRPVHGFCAESAGSLVLIGTAVTGIPVSTTHVIAGSIFGVGASKRVSSVRWAVARSIVGAWVLTIPASAAIAGATFLVLNIFS
ncbi:MAG: inorganic phosphate transporter [Candidatus Aenigmarchaeota archaeon]|nr:inorganic phosphate transporter [Candidatus Aenigmarchaeota archaeon]